MNPVLEELQKECAQAVMGLEAPAPGVSDDFKAARPTCPQLRRSDRGRLIEADYFPMEDRGMVVVVRFSRTGRFVQLCNADQPAVKRWFPAAEIRVMARMEVAA